MLDSFCRHYYTGVLKENALHSKISKTEYSNYRNKLTIELREAKTKYFKKQFEMNSNNIKKTWETINSIIKSKKVHSKTFLVDDDNIDIEENDIPNKFISYYSNIPLNLISNIPSSHHNLLDHPLPPRPVGDTS